MKLSIVREDILKPLQQVAGVVERRHNLPILSNLLLRSANGVLTLTGTDLEVELVTRIPMEGGEPGEITLPARKLLDIVRALPEGAQISLEVDGEKARLRSGRSRFVLATLPAAEFPTVDEITSPLELELPQGALRRLMERTQFAMAQQDVRYYLNGLMLELGPQGIRAVATDGHRLATCVLAEDPGVAEERQVIVPRKGVVELMRLLEEEGEPVRIQLGDNHIRILLDNVVFTSKLIDGKFPDYRRVIPEGGTVRVVADREALRQAFVRASVLSNEKYRGMRLVLTDGLLQATVHNPEQEEAEEEVEVDYSGPRFEIGFNVAYFLDALNAIPSEQVRIEMTDANSSCLVHGEGEDSCKYVIMPMRL